MARNTKRVRGPSANTLLSLAIQRERCKCGGLPRVSTTVDGEIKRFCLSCYWAYLNPGRAA